MMKRVGAIMMMTFIPVLVGLFVCPVPKESMEFEQAAPVTIASDSIVLPEMIISAGDIRLTKRAGKLYLKDTPYSGVTVEKWENGMMRSRTEWYEGEEHGVAEQWYENGMRMEKRSYAFGEKTGTHRGWYSGGILRFEYHFRNGVHEGEARDWYEGGSLYKKFAYVKGQEEGLQRMWSEDGTLRANYSVRDGKRYGSIGPKLCRSPEQPVVTDSPESSLMN